MSSSGQQPTNSKNGRSQAEQPYPQAPPITSYSEYESDSPTASYNNFIIDPQTLYMNNGYFNNPFEQPNYNDYIIEGAEFVTEDEVLPSDVAAEFIRNEQMMSNEQFNDNDEDESVFSDAVQNAFANYENEYSQQWKQNESQTIVFDDDEEQDDMMEQMRECMRFMSQEYSIAAMPQDLIEITQKSELNPDAVEFLPCWLPPSTDNDPYNIASSTLYEAENQQKE